MMNPMPSSEQVLQSLSAIEDPDFHKNIVELGFVQDLVIEPSGTIRFNLVLTTPACPVKDQFVADCKRLLGALPGVKEIEVTLKAMAPKAKDLSENSLLGSVRHIVAVSSCKGGVGKSTVTANLAMALALSGARVGVLDADIYGPSMVMMFGVDKAPEVREDRTLVPVSVAGIQLVSMAMFADPDKATIWRGPMVTQMIQNFLHRVHWGSLDYLLIDFPPGTGDIQLTLTQNCPISGAVVVTTPQEVALADVRKGLAMFRSVAVPVLGLVENMSFFICDSCSKRHHIFRAGGGRRTAEALHLAFLGEIPIEPQVAESGDAGKPIVYTQPNSEPGRVFLDIAGQVASALSVLAASESALGRFSLTWEDMPVATIPKGRTEQSPGNKPVAKMIVRTPDDRLAIGWSDGSVTSASPRELRLRCPCAACVDEWTGEPLLDQASVPLKLKPTTIHTVGRYAIGIAFDDGHHGGIYTFDHLRSVTQA